MSADSPRRSIRGVPAIVPPQVVSDRSIIDSVAGFINDVTLSSQQLQSDPKDTINWARFETCADISDITFGEDWELEGNVAPPLLLILGYGLGIQVWAIPANGEAVEVLSWRHGSVTALRILPTPLSADDEMADEPVDNFTDRRPLMAICDGNQSSGSGGVNQIYCAVNFVSLRTGSQVKTIKFKNNVLDILANRTSVVITFPERIAVFDARTLEDRLSVTTCYPSPGINPNPVALGSRWMAYSENKLLHSKRSGGGCDGDNVASYTATVLNAAKSLGKGLRELGEQVAAGLTGSSGSAMLSKTSSFDSVTNDIRQSGVITIMDIKNSIKEISPTTGTAISTTGADPIIAHFIAHTEAIVAIEFDPSGMLLITADKRGHDFHVFRIQPHLAGPHFAAIHHLYILHRGDTTAKVQNIAFALDSRWIAVSTLRGTTHVFPITPYGGAYTVRTHASLHVVNKLSRFHRSAGLSGDTRSSSPISHSDSMMFNPMCMPYSNPTMPPYPRPHVILPLAQLRQPSVLGTPPGSATQNLSYQKLGGSNSSGGSNCGRQRLSSLSDDCGKPLSVCAVFAKARSWLVEQPNNVRDGHKNQRRKSVDSLFIMAGHGALIQYDLDTKLASNIAKEKICDDSPIELDVEAKAQWNLGRREINNSTTNFVEIQPPLTSDNWLMKDRSDFIGMESHLDDLDERNERWLSQVEIITHAGPHRRLWMGPQFVFKTYNTPSGSNLSHIDTEAVEIGLNSREGKPGRSSPMNMPISSSGRSAIPVLIESGSYSSIEQSPKLMDRFKHDYLDSDYSVQHGESRLKEDLADAMRECPSTQHKDSGLYVPGSRKITNRKHLSSQSSSSDNDNKFGSWKSALSSIVPDDYNSDSPSEDVEELTSLSSNTLIEKIVNPLGTVTTLAPSNNIEPDRFSTEDCVIHENCDEALFRPVVAIFCSENEYATISRDIKPEKPPEPVGVKLIVPVIEESQHNKKILKKMENKIFTEEKDFPENAVKKFSEMSLRNKKSNKAKTNEQPIPLETQICNKNTVQLRCEPSPEVFSNSNTSELSYDEKQGSEPKIDIKAKNSVHRSEASEKYRKSEEVGIETVKCVSETALQKSTSYISEQKDKQQKVERTLNKFSPDFPKKDNAISSKKKEKVASKKNDEDFAFPKVLKDDDSESFESLENIEDNEELTALRIKLKELSSAENDQNSEISMIKAGDIKKNYAEKTIALTKTSKKNKNFKAIEQEKQSGTKSESILDKQPEGLVFFDNKFTNDSPTDSSKNIISDEDVKVEVVDLPSLTDSLSEFKCREVGVDKVSDVIVIKKNNAKKSDIEFMDKVISSNKEEHFAEPESLKIISYAQMAAETSSFPPVICESEKTDTKKKNVIENLELTSKDDGEFEDKGNSKIEFSSKIKNSEKINKTTIAINMEKASSSEDLKVKDNKPKYQSDSSDSCETITITLPSKKNKKKNKSNFDPKAQKTSKKSSTESLNEKINKEIRSLTSPEKILTTEIPNLEFDPAFLPPLSPLEPLEDPREFKGFEDNYSLINFESPSTPRNSKHDVVADTSKSKDFSESNLIFALCGSLHYENESLKNAEQMPDTKVIEIMDYKSLAYDDVKTKLEAEEVQFEPEPQFLQIKQNRRRQKGEYTEITTSSSSDAEDSSSSSNMKKSKLKLNANDDEELRPLIDRSITNSYISISGKKKKNVRKSSTENDLNLSLVDINQSGDSSSEQTATTSEDEPIIVLPSISPRKLKNGETNDQAESSVVGIGSLEDYLPNISSSNNLQQTETTNNTAVSSSNNNNTNLQQQSLKKKSKRRKR